MQQDGDLPNGERAEEAVINLYSIYWTEYALVLFLWFGYL